MNMLPKQQHNHRTLKIGLAAILATASITNFSHAQSGSDDPMPKAMQEELAREKSILLPGMQAPYFIEYRMDDFSTYEAIANYGALTRQERAPRIHHQTGRTRALPIKSSRGRLLQGKTHHAHRSARKARPRPR